ncbi:MAG: hypothetical protein ACERKS_13205 [Candidatus Bathyarchaeota archaeon]
MEYDNNNRGALWVNKKKEQESHPDCTGSCTIDGVDYYMNMWGKKNPEGNQPRFSLTFKLKDKQPNITEEGRTNGIQTFKEAAAKLGGTYVPGEDKDDIPF